MAAARDAGRWSQVDERVALGASEPLIRPLSYAALGRLCANCAVVGLILAWCVVDNWNEVVWGALFKVGVADGTADDHEEPQYFQGPITLIFLQFLFMGGAFAGLWACTAQDHQQQIAKVQETFFSAPWPLLVVSHVFCSFWLHTLTMPSQIMSLGVFAASRAMEVPIAATLRFRGLEFPAGEQSLQIVVSVFMANMLLFYSYVQMEGCVCIWSGHGFHLSGLPLYVIFFLLLALPAVNVVCQESMMTRCGMNPFLMLALQNILACVMFSPMLVLEDVRRSLSMMVDYEEIGLLVVWLCIQATALSCAGVLLVRRLNSFWAVALRSMRVVYWWAWQLAAFYASTHSLLSLMNPKVSAWSFGMLAGVSLAAAALAADLRRTAAGGVGDAKEAALRPCATPGGHMEDVATKHV